MIVDITHINTTISSYDFRLVGSQTLFVTIYRVSILSFSVNPYDGVSMGDILKWIVYREIPMEIDDLGIPPFMETLISYTVISLMN